MSFVTTVRNGEVSYSDVAQRLGSPAIAKSLAHANGYKKVFTGDTLRIPIINNISESEISNNIFASEYFFCNMNTDQGKQKYIQLTNMYNVDLTDQNNECTFVYRIYPKLASVRSTIIYLGIIRTKAKYIIAIIQSVINSLLVEYGVSIPITGMFDCNTAKYMVIIAQWARQSGVGQVNYWPIGQLEFTYCMSKSNEIMSSLRKSITDFDKLFYSNIDILHNNKFLGKSVPNSCYARILG